MVDQSKVPNWKSVVSVIVGGLLLLIAIADPNHLMVSFTPEIRRIIISAGLSLILSGLGSYASGQWRRWHFQGAAALIVFIYFLLWYTSEPLSEPAMIGRLSNLPDSTRTVEVSAESEERLYGYFRRHYHEFKVRIEEKHLKSGCLHFVLVTLEEQQDVLEVHKVLPAKLIEAQNHQKRGQGDVVEISYVPKEGNGTKGIGTLHYLDNDQKPQPISQPENSCTPNVKTAKPYTPSLLTQVYAGVPSKVSDEDELLKDLKSDDLLLRYEAQQILSTYPPEVIRSILEHFDNFKKTSKEAEYLATGLVVVIEGMLQKGVKPDEIRTQLKEKDDLEKLARILNHPDHLYSFGAMDSLIRLRDSRVNPFLVEILKSEEENDGKYYAAVLLKEGFPALNNDQKKEVRNTVSDLLNKGNFDKRIRDLLDTIVSSSSNLQKETPKGKSAPIGWVYIGSNFSGPWQEKYFNWTNDKSELPTKGNILQATGSVHLRNGYIEFDSEVGRWVNKDVVGLIRPGDKVKVTRIKEVTTGFYWAEITRAD